MHGEATGVALRQRGRRGCRWSGFEPASAVGRPAPGNSLRPTHLEISGFRNHKSLVNIAGVCGVKEMNGEEPSRYLNGKPAGADHEKHERAVPALSGRKVARTGSHDARSCNHDSVAPQGMGDATCASKRRHQPERARRFSSGTMTAGGACSRPLPTGGSQPQSLLSRRWQPHLLMTVTSSPRSIAAFGIQSGFGLVHGY
ncbi:hypothetical protein HDG37_007433 [Paraburkholderia sp. MM5384-R2]|nr:hypothetical protein [Paraburkholderia sp. MM5384-R2]